MRGPILIALATALASACTGSVDGVIEGQHDGDLDTTPVSDDAPDVDVVDSDPVVADDDLPVDLGPDVDRSEAKLYTITKKPSELDDAASTGTDNDAHDDTQYAYLDTRAAPQGRLVIFLVGATSSPGAGQTMGRYLASLGFHVIVPAYANAYGIGVCAASNDDDADCHGKVRLEALEGVDHSAHIEVTRADSAEEHVVKMLEHLRDNEPHGDWGHFLESGLPRWAKVVITGHSHGASSTGVYAKKRTFERAVMLSGPYDSYDGAPAAWTASASLTPRDKIFGFTHADEDQYSGHLDDWEAMELPGAPIIVGNSAPPYAQSHRLVTNTAPVGGNDNGHYHGSTMASSASPMADGTYVYDPAWRYLYGAPKP